MKLIYLDTETTGFIPGSIVQLSYLIENDDGPAGVENFYMDTTYMEEQASEVTGLTVEKIHELSGGKTFKNYAGQIYKDMEDAVIIGHNSSFDIKFIREEFRRCGLKYIPKEVKCTMQFMRDIIKLPDQRGKGYKNPKLSEVLQYLNISEADVERFTKAVYKQNTDMHAHDSRYDAIAVYLICKKLEKIGIKIV